MKTVSTFSLTKAVGSAYAPALGSRSSFAAGLRISAKATQSTTSSPLSVKDTVDLSESAQAVLDAQKDSMTEEETEKLTLQIQKAEEDKAVIDYGQKVASNIREEADKEKLRDLRERDKKVRAHLDKQKREAGNLAQGTPNIRYERGPDGQMYAVEGHVSIRVKSGTTAEERIRNADKAERVARGSGDGSPANVRVQQEARAEKERAQKELEREKRDEENISPLAGKNAFTSISKTKPDFEPGPVVKSSDID